MASPTSGVFYTETTDMENYWSSLVWQNGGEIISPDHTQTLLGSDQAVGGIQRLQDLIYTDKIMPTPDLFVQTGDAFEQGQAAMEANGSWLVPTHLAAGIDLGIAKLPAGPAGRATSINPTGVVVANIHQGAGCGLGVREVPGGSGSADPADAAQGCRAGGQERAGRGLRHGIPGVAMCSPHPSLTPISSRPSGATTTGPRRSSRSST